MGYEKPAVITPYLQDDLFCIPKKSTLIPNIPIKKKKSFLLYYKR